MGVILLRTIVLYTLIIFALRVMGKRQIGELQASELVVTILVSNIATLSIEDMNVPILVSVLPIFTLMACEVGASVLTMKSNTMRKIITGNPCIIIRDGMIDQRVMSELRWSTEDLVDQLRIANIFDVGEVSCAIVETSGKLSVFKKFESREATAGMLKIPIENECDSPSMIVISDGKFVPDAFNFCNIKQEWAEQELKKQNLTVGDVFLMTLNRRAQYYLCVKNKKGGAKK
ncbi:MAG: DUF421 domain-containing protein [Oscillospiraceae bacterium]|nr:DUF421 domain-containing protein [Oscillospiraceae bacterium]